MTAFPKFQTPVTPTLAADITNDHILANYVSSGTTLAGNYRAYRNDLYVFPTQRLTATTSTQVVQAQDAGKRAFYEIDSTKVGAFPPATSADKSNVTTDSRWVACTVITDVAKCNSGVGWNGTASKSIVSRIIMRAGVSGAIPSYGDGESAAFTWQSDLVLASFYHPTWGSTTPVTDGSKWCSNFKNVINKDKSTASVV